MKRILLTAALAFCTAAYALPTYEPFTEYAAAIAASPTNAINLGTGGYSAPSGEAWTSMNFHAGTAALDINVTNYGAGSMFTYTALSSILPAGFPGLPSPGGAITIFCVNPAQPGAPAGVVGNSAVLNFAQDISRPTSGTKTLFFSYLFSVAQKGQTGSGNVGRYLGVVASTNTALPNSFYTTWASFFNAFGTAGTSPKYFGHGVFNGSPDYIEPPDSSNGKNPATPPTTFSVSYNQPYFIVGEFVFTTAGNTDQNIVWVNPSTSSFGGFVPPASPQIANTMAITMSDLGGMVLIDRVGSGASGGVGTNYIANLIIGSTWSYVTGGPEFTNQPLAVTAVPLGGNASLTGSATAAGQSVTYQWVKISNGGATTNNVTNGAGGAGGGATVSGATTSTLSLTGVTAADTGNYQSVATASGTGFKLNSSTAVLALTDPQVTANPASTTVNYHQSASFTATVGTSYAPLSWGWYVGATPLSNGPQADGSYAIGATGTTGAGSSFSITLTLTNVSYLDIGNYTLFVTNSLSLYNSASPASLAVNDPYIITQPANPSVADGGNASFSIVAAGSPNLSYQWYEGTTALNDGGTTVGGTATVSGSLTPTLTLTGVHDADNGTYYCKVPGSASLQTATSASARLTVQDALTIASTPKSLAERVGDHLAFTVAVSGGGPQFQWSHNNTAISGATSSSLVLTNIQTGDGGTYSVVVQNLLTAPQTLSPTLTVINDTVLPLSAANLVVARVGDGVQTLSGATGNTLYLDQYTAGGTYVNTIQVPDEGTGQSYGTGSANSAAMPFGSPALLVQGAGADAGFEAMLTLSSVNQEYLCFAAYCEAYPFSGADVTINGNNFWRGLGLVNAYGLYSLAYTNTGLYSGGNHTIRSSTSLDGTNFYTTGQASGGTVKFVTAGSAGVNYANGTGVPSSTGVSGAGGRAVQVVNGPLFFTGASNTVNVVMTDAAGPAGNGLYAAPGTPEPGANQNMAFTQLLATFGTGPADFAFSPDNATVYVADSGSFTGTGDGTSGGIQRFDTNSASGGYSYSYTLQPLPPGTSGAQGLVVDFGANTTWGPGVTGAKLYATTTGASTNSLVEIVDEGASSVPTVLVTAGPNQALRGVRFGPAAVPPSIASAPQDLTVPVGNSATFSVAASGSAPIFYQWFFGSTAIAGATQSTFTTNNPSYASAGSYTVVVSNLTTQTASATATLTVTAGAPTIAPTPLPSYTEMAGDHVGWGPAVTGTQPLTNYWYLGSTLVQSNVTPGASGTLALTNIQPANNGTYTLVVSNTYGHASASGVLTVSAARQTLSPANVVVARVGDGAQPLSAATGNTIYLDQYTPAGGYVNTIQVPDQGLGQPYGTGSSSSASMGPGSPSLLVAGAGADAPYEAFLTLAPNAQTLNFGGYCQAYPFAGADVSIIAGGSANWHGIAGVNAYGYYTLFYTNTGLYSAGNKKVHGAVDLNGSGTNFYSTGQANSAGIKFLDVAFEPASGNGIIAVAGSTSGTHVAQIVQGNLVFSDALASTPGIYGCGGLPTTANATSALLLAETNSPMDFAASPDLQTVYVTDNGTFGGTSAAAGGIQRWDANGTGNLGFPTYGFSYTLGTGAGSTVGARGLAVDFSARTTWGPGVTGAKLYVTTAEPSGNRLLSLVDNGAASTPALVSLAGPNQALAGVRFGPTIVAPSFAAQPQPYSAPPTFGGTFAADAVGSGPLTYQWYFQANGAGAFVAIPNATNSSYTISSAGPAYVGNYYVVVTNPGNVTITSDTVSFTLLPAPQITSWSAPTDVANGSFTINFTGPAGYSYTVWSSSNVGLTPVRTTWTNLGSGTFSGGTDSFTDSNAGSNPEQCYVITMP
ncbi:MAG TPA: immunoglobulin domain-containing protein [Candidatus Acidoferrum sp.]|nr:immunoglobulin domain-containing protein [Candidatus Acidoferrum sp.]